MGRQSCFGAECSSTIQRFLCSGAPRIMAYYPLTAGINQRALRAVKTALETLEHSEIYSAAFRQTFGFQEDLEDFTGIHLPAVPEESKTARRSLAKKNYWFLTE